MALYGYTCPECGTQFVSGFQQGSDLAPPYFDDDACPECGRELSADELVAGEPVDPDELDSRL